jgi:RNA polymerase sigma factor (sigma-70 family)
MRIRSIESRIMVGERSRTVGGDVRRLFEHGTLAGLAEWQLLDRFLADQDSAAFEALVARFGPMVLGVCRRLLRDPHDAEDAFQATFMLLVRKARSIRNRGLVGPWLYRAAQRVCMRARRRAARRRVHEREGAGAAADRAETVGAAELDLAAVLHAELDRLPEKYRAPLVLCYLQGRTHAEAAVALRWPLGSVKGRLARARDLLRERLVRRGLAPTAVGTIALSSQEALACVPPALIHGTCLVARAALVGESVVGTGIPASVRELVNGVSGTMVPMTLRRWLTGATLATLAAGSVGVAYQATGDSQRSDQPGHARLRAYDSTRARPRPTSEEVSVEGDLAKLVDGRIVKSVPIAKDCMVLAYLPAWNHGNVDNIAVANNGGGVRTLLEWPDIDPAEVAHDNRQFLLALYSRETTSKAPFGPLLVFEIIEEWPERTSWQTMPACAEDPVATLEFAPGNGWKVIDITAVVRARARGRLSNGVLLRFLNEDHGGTRGDWSGYAFVSRDAPQPSHPRRPVLLVVEPGAK